MDTYYRLHLGSRVVGFMRLRNGRSRPEYLSMTRDYWQHEPIGYDSKRKLSQSPQGIESLPAA